MPEDVKPENVEEKKTDKMEKKVEKTEKKEKEDQVKEKPETKGVPVKKEPEYRGPYRDISMHVLQWKYLLDNTKGLPDRLDVMRFIRMIEDGVRGADVTGDEVVICRFRIVDIERLQSFYKATKGLGIDLFKQALCEALK